MSDNHRISTRKSISKAIRSLYLYPQGTKEENIVRGLIWIVSWLIGIHVPAVQDFHALGGAYLIFAMSLFVDMIVIKRDHFCGGLMYLSLNLLLLASVVGAFVMIFSPNAPNYPNSFWGWLAKELPTFGRIIAGWLFAAVILSIPQWDKALYDDEAEKKKQNERKDYERAVELLKIFFESERGITKRRSGK